MRIGNLKEWISMVAAALLVCTFSIAQTQTPGGGISSAAVTVLSQTAAGWTANGTDTRVFGSGIMINAASPNILRLSGDSDTINLGDASGIELIPSAGQRVRMVGNVMFDGNLTWNDFTDDSATTGSRTVNTSRGKNAFAAAASTITITNSTATANSNVVCGLETADSTCKSVICVPAAGSFTATVNAACTATTKLGWAVIK